MNQTVDSPHRWGGFLPDIYSIYYTAYTDIQEVNVVNREAEYFHTFDNEIFTEVFPQAWETCAPICWQPWLLCFFLRPSYILLVMTNWKHKNSCYKLDSFFCVLLFVMIDLLFLIVLSQADNTLTTCTIFTKLKKKQPGRPQTNAWFLTIQQHTHTYINLFFFLS